MMHKSPRYRRKVRAQTIQRRKTYVQDKYGEDYNHFDCDGKYAKNKVEKSCPIKLQKLKGEISFADQKRIEALESEG